jgi:hypothetical protein
MPDSTDLDDPDANTCVGNTYSQPMQVNFADKDASRVVKIVADQV